MIYSSGLSLCCLSLVFLNLQFVNYQLDQVCLDLSHCQVQNSELPAPNGVGNILTLTPIPLLVVKLFCAVLKTSKEDQDEELV